MEHYLIITLWPDRHYHGAIHILTLCPIDSTNYMPVVPLNVSRLGRISYAGKKMKKVGLSRIIKIFRIRILTNDAVLFYTLTVSVSTCYLFYPNRTRRFLWLWFYWLDTSPPVLSPSSGIYTPTYFSCITNAFRFVNANLL